MGKLIYLLSASLLVAMPAVAKDKHKKGHKAESKHSVESAEVKTIVVPAARPELVAKVTITTAEREAIEKHLSVQSKNLSYTTPVVNNSRALPPGLAKKAAAGKPLPPGWQKKMMAGETMPIEVYHRCQPLPRDLTIKLPPQPKGVITVTVEGKVVRLLEATREILDVFDVLPR